MRLEVCCGSYEDALVAINNGAHRIELNSALYLGGLTPSMATIKAVLEIAKAKRSKCHCDDSSAWCWFLL